MFDIARDETNFVSSSDDYNTNGIPDIDEMGLLAAIMMNPFYPFSNEANAIFLANANQFFSEIVAGGYLEPVFGGLEASRYFSTGVSGLVTLGILPASAIGLGSDDANYDSSLADDITVDYNQDGSTNADEWITFAGNRQAWIENMLPALPVAGALGLAALAVAVAALAARRRKLH
ncbi:MAG: hypothetical protein GWP08_13235 [Nitrospiraceae bacterium]|nr:hypothetical protein [Nitrospiraceae bacterium]